MELLFKHNLIAVDDNDELILTNSFETTVHEVKEQLGRNSRDTIRSTFFPDNRESWLVNVVFDHIDSHREFISMTLSLFNSIEELDLEGAIKMAILVDGTVGPNPPPGDGAPDYFVPIHGELIPLVTKLHHRCIVYTWRYDCPPCDRMVQVFNKLVDVPRDDILCVAVYGPDSAALLREGYDVVGSPTTLFFKDGAIDTRLIGAQYDIAVKAEFQHIIS